MGTNIKNKLTQATRAVAKRLPTDPRLRVAVILAGFMVLGGAALASEQVVKEIPKLVEQAKPTPAGPPAYPAPEGSPTPYPQPGVLAKEIKIYVTGGAFAQNLPFVTNPIQKDDGTPASDVPVDFVLTRPDGTQVAFTMETNGAGRVIGVIAGSELTENGEYTIAAKLTEGTQLAGQTTFAIAETKSATGAPERVVEVTQGPPGEPGHPGATGATGATGAAGSEGPAGPEGPSGEATCPLGPCVSLQGDTGSTQTGNIVLSGTIKGADFEGDGAGVTNVNAAQLGGQSSGFFTNASNLNAGTLDNARLNANVTLLGQTIDNADLAGGITNEKLAGGITDDKLDTITAAGKVANSALSGSVTLLGNSFNGAGQLVQLSGTGALPAVSGANLTDVTATTLDGQDGSYYLDLANATGTLADARLSGNVTVAGNAFNAAGQLVQLGGAGELPAVSGANLTSVNAVTLGGQGSGYFTNASNLSSGTVDNARLNANVTLLGRSTMPTWLVGLPTTN